MPHYDGFEIILPKRVVVQPTPHIVDIGDCGACVAAGIIGVGVKEIYERLDKQGGLTWRNMGSALRNSDEIEHVMDRVPFWSADGWNAPMGMSGLQSWIAWADYLRIAFTAGYYAATQVDMHEQGIREDSDWLEINHWQLICGIRGTSTGTLKRELLVSCSAASTPDLEWVSAKRFLARRGGYNAILAKPSDKD